MDEPARYRVMVVDDNTFIRAGLTSALEATDDIEVVGEAGDGREAEEMAWRLVPDVVLLDVRMPRADGVGAAAALSRISRVIMLTQVEEPEVILSAVRNGAVGYLVHNTFTVDELAAAIRDTVRHRAHPSRTRPAPRSSTPRGRAGPRRPRPIRPSSARGSAFPPARSRSWI